MVTHPRYYLFDPGITNALSHTLGEQLNPRVRGRRFEQFVITQILAFIHYNRLDYQLYYWRTNHGSEVDLLICRGRNILCAVEIKSSQNIARETLDGSRSFLKAHPDVPMYVLGHNQNLRQLAENFTVMNWDNFIIHEMEKIQQKCRLGTGTK